MRAPYPGVQFRFSNRQEHILIFVVTVICPSKRMLYQ